MKRENCPYLKIYVYKCLIYTTKAANINLIEKVNNWQERHQEVNEFHV